jgi:hypothetical protein
MFKLQKPLGQPKGEDSMGTREEFVTKDDLEKSLGKFKGEIIHEFHLISEGLMDHIKLLAEGHPGVIQRLDRIENRFDRMEKENERQHIETRALIKISFSELERRLSDLETQMKEMQEWRKQVQDRLQI